MAHKNCLFCIFHLDSASVESTHNDRNQRFTCAKCLHRSLLYPRVKASVAFVYCCMHCIHSQLFRKLLFNGHASTHFKYCAPLLLSDSVLIRRVWGRLFMVDLDSSRECLNSPEVNSTPLSDLVDFTFPLGAKSAISFSVATKV